VPAFLARLRIADCDPRSRHPAAVANLAAAVEIACSGYTRISHGKRLARIARQIDGDPWSPASNTQNRDGRLLLLSLRLSLAVNARVAGILARYEGSGRCAWLIRVFQNKHISDLRRRKGLHRCR